MTPLLQLVARLSLAVLWIFTGITSAFLAPEIGYEVLAIGGITGRLADLSIAAGSLLDVILGIWVLSGKQLKACYAVQCLAMLTYTLLLTVIAPSFWLHPFGPLTKNIPIGVLIVFLYRMESERSAQA